MELKNIPYDCRIVRRPPFPEHDIWDAVLTITSRFVESCHKARQLGKKHRKQFEVGIQALKEARTSPATANSPE